MRYYERIGLMPAPPRTEGGHRLYTAAHLRRLTFVRRARDLGFTIEAIRTLLSLADQERPCAAVRELATEHLKSVRDKIADLLRLETILADTVNKCDTDKPECAVLEMLDAPA